ncbi:PilW family protein [Clostridium sp. B9]|uniref:PilW family protein n=1 Tax=Clostridium sp. B9 TaxID=3423224 RepID=UPI003D2EE87C
MSKLKDKKRGLSLIELVVALSLITIILMIVGPFFISNYKSLNKTSNQIDFQRESKVILDHFGETAMECGEIFKIKADAKDVDLSKTNNISGENVIITFVNNETENQVRTSFRLKNGTLTYNRKLKSNNFKDNKITIGKFIKNITYTAMPKGTTFENANSIEVKIVFDTSNAEPYEVKNIFAFRNKK